MLLTCLYVDSRRIAVVGLTTNFGRDEGFNRSTAKEAEFGRERKSGRSEVRTN